MHDPEKNIFHVKKHINFHDTKYIKFDDRFWEANVLHLTMGGGGERGGGAVV